MNSSSYLQIIKRIAIFAVLALTIGLIGAAEETISDEIMRRQSQQQQESDRVRQLEEQQLLKQKNTSVEPTDLPPIIAEDGKCIDIQIIDTSNFDLVSRSAIDSITQAYQNRCLSTADMSALVNELSKLYHNQGLITTRVGLVLPQTKLKQGVLMLSLQKGLLADVTLNSQLDNLLLTEAMLFNDLIDEPLNAYQLEQRINHINRLSSHQAQFKISPSDQPYYSDLALDDSPVDTTFISLEYSDSGSDATGIDVMNFSTELDDFIIPLSKWSLSYNTPIGADEDLNNSNAYNLAVSIPYQNYLWTYEEAQSDYLTHQILTTDDIFYSFGTTHSNEFYLTRYLNKTKDNDHNIKLGLSLRDEKNYSEVRDVVTFNEVGSRKLSVLSLDYQHTASFDNQVLFINPTLRRGINEFDALDDQESDLDQKAQFDLFKLYGYYNTPLVIKDKQFGFRTTFSMQISEDELFGSEVFTLGGESSIRGFKEDSLSAKSGFYIQNELTLNLNQFLTEQRNDYIAVSIFADYGRLYPSTSEHQTLSGIGVSLNYQHKNLEFSLTSAINTQREDIEETEATYLSIKFKF